MDMISDHFNMKTKLNLQNDEHDSKWHHEQSIQWENELTDILKQHNDLPLKQLNCTQHSNLMDRQTPPKRMKGGSVVEELFEVEKAPASDTDNANEGS